jgi:CDP-diacylglycerol---serine O-phosphatidyltransferase
MRLPPRSIVPNLFTVMNLFSGFIAIKTAFVDQNYITAGWFIVLGAAFDTLDGLMARLTKSASDFGVELDSLADVVTFGIAPSAIIYQLYFSTIGEPWGLLVSALPAIFGALRLARFNSQLVGYDKEYFKGLPIPSAAILIVSFISFYYLHPSRLEVINVAPETGLWVVIIGAAILMVSTVRYEAMPKFSKRGLKEKPLLVGGFVIGLIAAIVTKGVAIFPLFSVFILFGVIRFIIERIRKFIKEGRAEALFDEEELGREDEATFGA